MKMNTMKMMMVMETAAVMIMMMVAAVMVMVGGGALIWKESPALYLKATKRQ